MSFKTVKITKNRANNYSLTAKMIEKVFLKHFKVIPLTDF